MIPALTSMLNFLPGVGVIERGVRVAHESYEYGDKRDWVVPVLALVTITALEILNRYYSEKKPNSSPTSSEQESRPQ